MRKVRDYDAELKALGLDVDEIAAIVQDETAYVPLHVQPLLWGSKSSVSLVQRPDNFFLLRWVTIAE